MRPRECPLLALSGMSARVPASAFGGKADIDQSLADPRFKYTA